MLSGRMRPAYILLLVAFVAWVESTPGYFEYGFHRRRGADFCLRRHDGRYAVGCVPQFVTCSSKMHASSCRGHGHLRLPHGLVPSFTPVEPGSELSGSRFCKHRADGDYNIGCTSCYISYSGNHAFSKECPAGLVLDEASGLCVERSYVAVCGGVPTTTSDQYNCDDHNHHVDNDNYSSSGLGSNDGADHFPSSRALHPLMIPGPSEIVLEKLENEKFSRFHASRDARIHSQIYASFQSSPVTTITMVSSLRAVHPGTSSASMVAHRFVHADTGLHSTNSSKFVSPRRDDTDASFRRDDPDASFRRDDANASFRRDDANASIRINDPDDCYALSRGSRLSQIQYHFSACTAYPEIGSEAAFFVVKPCRHRNSFFAIGCSSRYVACIDGLPTYHTCRRGLTFDERRRTCLPKSGRTKGKFRSKAQSGKGRMEQRLCVPVIDLQADPLNGAFKRGA
ncbi:unnamed protein product [Toxocara canis]|uniref:Chitin-binding type-2 domain-containing protein n=1 Tax=Toxocara canis TaxID=6265 RepID=A0A3P7F5Z3_TOXCA|nr:unnamed protein product [Toxocara canis]